MITALINLFSRKPVNVNGAIALPDGAIIWQLLTKSGNKITNLLNAFSEAEIYFEFHYGSRKKACQMVEDLYAQGKCTTVTRTLLTVPDRRGDDVDKTIDHARKLLGESKHADQIRAVVQNNLAYCLLTYGRRSELAEAESLSKQAVETMPMSLPAISTRGSVLIELDRLQEGLALLEDKRFVIENTKNRAEVMAMRAKGYSLLGEYNKSQEMLKKAKSLAADNILVSRAISALEK